MNTKIMLRRGSMSWVKDGVLSREAIEMELNEDDYVVLRYLRDKKHDDDG